MENQLHVIQPEGSQLTGLVTDYLAHCRAGGLSPATVDRSYSPALRDIFLPWCEQEKISQPAELTERALDRFTTALLARPSKRGGSLSKFTVRSYIGPVRLFLAWADRRGEQVHALPRRPKVGKRHRDVLSRDEIESMDRAAVNVRDKLIVRLFADCGLRLGELTRLRLQDIKRSENRTVLHIRGKGDRDRRVPVPPGLAPRLQRYLASRPKDPETDAVFLGLRRAPHSGLQALGESGAAHMICDLAKRAGIERPVHPHLLRHSWMTEMLRRGVNPIQLSVIAGASQQVIAQHYSHLNEDDAFAAMARAFSPG